MGWRRRCQSLVPALTGRHLLLAGDLYIAAMEALYPINPAILFLVEGTAQPQFVVNAGDGLVTSVPLIEATGASNPSTFFRTLLTKPYAQQVGTTEWLPSTWGWLLEVLCLAAVCLRHAPADGHLQRHSLPAVAKPSQHLYQQNHLRSLQSRLLSSASLRIHSSSLNCLAHDSPSAAGCAHRCSAASL